MEAWLRFMRCGGNSETANVPARIENVKAMARRNAPILSSVRIVSVNLVLSRLTLSAPG